MMRALVRTLVACGLFACGVVPQTSHAAGPRHDVFERPKRAVLKQLEPEPVKTQKPPVAPVEWKPELRAIIQGGTTSWVNVEGRILQVGQDMDGFRLVDVLERRAVFVKDEMRYTLELRDVRSASRASALPATGAKAVAGTSPGTDGKPAGDAAPAAAAKVAADPGPTAGAKASADSAPADASTVPADRGRLGAIKASAILPKREVPPPDLAAGGSGGFAEARGR